MDVRVSTLPSANGERVVLRLLDKQAGRLTLTHLGMSPRDRRLMEEAVRKPHGIILVTGPTGSGKTCYDRYSYFEEKDEALSGWHNCLKGLLQQEVGDDDWVEF